jgi:hypothetical protein
MTQEIHQLIRCNLCNGSFAETVQLDFGMPTEASIDRLNAQAVAAGWLYVPPDLRPGRPGVIAKHYCPNCKAYAPETKNIEDHLKAQARSQYKKSTKPGRARDGH